MTFNIPNDALDERLAFVGTSGSGKTYSAGVIAERLLHRKSRVIVIDPLGVWWGLRMLADGKTESRFNVVIFGGDHADLPINEHAGALIGETVAGMAESCIVDLSGFGTKAVERRFMLAFLEAIYRKASGEPVHLIFDEADLWAPQKALEPQLQAKMEQIVRRGRVKGFIPYLITQRPAVLSKDVLSQADGLIAFKLTSSHDRDAIKAWIEGQADKAREKEILGALPTMQRGEAVVWIPSRGIIETMQFPAKVTLDSSRTPKRGETVNRVALKPLDLGKLKEKLATVEAETKANDPQALKAEIARLVSENRKLINSSKPDTPDPKAIEEADRQGFARGYAQGFIEGKVKTFEAINDGADSMALDASKAYLANVQRMAGFVVTPKIPASPTPRPGVTGAGARPSPPVVSKPSPAASGDGGISPSARRILDVIHRSYPVALSFDAAARRAGISKRSSAYRGYRADVGSSPEVEQVGDRYRSLPGYANSGPIDPHATIEQWASKLPPTYGSMLRVIAERGPIAKDEIAERAGVSIKSSGLGAGIRELMDLELIVQENGSYKLAEGLS